MNKMLQKCKPWMFNGPFGCRSEAPDLQSWECSRTYWFPQGTGERKAQKQKISNMPTFNLPPRDSTWSLRHITVIRTIKQNRTTQESEELSQNPRIHLGLFTQNAFLHSTALLFHCCLCKCSLDRRVLTVALTSSDHPSANVEHLSA